MTSLTYIPVEGERIVAQSSESILTNYRMIQYDSGSRQSVSIPWHMFLEYKLTPRSMMIKVTNGIVNLLGNLPRREEVRGAIGLREFDSLTVGQERKLCEVSGVPFIHPDHPYNRWVSIGYHRRFSRHFYEEYAWLKGEEIFTYMPDNFILTNYRLYQFDKKKRKMFIFPMHMVHTFEARKDKIVIKATTGKFVIVGKVPRQDSLVKVWQTRAWDKVPKDHLEWLVRNFNYIHTRHPLDQYTIKDSQRIAPAKTVTETSEEMQVDSTTAAAGGTVFVKPQIKNKCMNCGATMSWESIDWVGPDQYACQNCGHSHNVDYVRM